VLEIYLIAKQLRSDCLSAFKSIAQRSQTNRIVIAKLLQRDCKEITQRLQIDYKSIAKQLQSHCKAIGNDFKAIPNRFQTVA
jgi:guanylate kinase